MSVCPVGPVMYYHPVYKGNIWPDKPLSAGVQYSYRADKQATQIPGFQFI